MRVVIGVKRWLVVATCWIAVFALLALPLRALVVKWTEPDACWEVVSILKAGQNISCPAGASVFVSGADRDLVLAICACPGSSYLGGQVDGGAPR